MRVIKEEREVGVDGIGYVVRVSTEQSPNRGDACVVDVTVRFFGVTDLRAVREMERYGEGAGTVRLDVRPWPLGEQLKRGSDPWDADDDPGVGAAVTTPELDQLRQLQGLLGRASRCAARAIASLMTDAKEPTR